MHDSLGNGAEGIILNDNLAPFDDPRMREAFVSMLNLDVIADVRLNGHRELAGAIGLIAPTSPVYNPEVEDVWPQFDVERATQLIEEYRAEGNDPNFTFKLPNTPDRRRFGEMAGQFFSDAGVDVTMEYLDISEFVTGVLNTGDFQAAINSYPAFIGQYPQMWNAYHSGGLSNFGKFSDPEIDALLETAVSTHRRGRGQPGVEGRAGGDRRSHPLRDVRPLALGDHHPAVRAGRRQVPRQHPVVRDACRATTSEVGSGGRASAACARPPRRPPR